MKDSILIVISIKYPNNTVTGIWSRCSSLKFFFKMAICNAISKRLNIIVNLPRVSGRFKLKTKGIDEIGEVPRIDLVIKLTPKELMNRPIKNNIYLFILSFVVKIFPLFY